MFTDQFQRWQRGWTAVTQMPLICMQSCVLNGVVISEVAIVWLNAGKHTVHIHTQSSWKNEQKSSVRSASRYEWGYLIYITIFKQSWIQHQLKWGCEPVVVSTDCEGFVRTAGHLRIQKVWDCLKDECTCTHIWILFMYMVLAIIVVWNIVSLEYDKILVE